MEETNSTATPPVEPIMPQGALPQKPRRGGRWLMIVIAFVVLLGAGAAGYYYNNQQPKPYPDQQDQSQNQPQDNAQKNEEPQDRPTDKQPLVSGLVTWRYPQPTSAELLKRVAPESEGVAEFNPINDSRYYDLGTFTSGKYKDYSLLMLSAACEGPCQSYDFFFAADQENSKYALLEKYSDSFKDYPYLDLSKISSDKTYDIKDLDFPESIRGTANGQTLKRVESIPFSSTYETFNSTGLKFVYNDPQVGAVYTTPDNNDSVEGIYQMYGFYVKAPDYRVLVYQYLPDFVSADQPIAAVTWNDGTTNKNPYTWTERHGCGSNFAAVTTGLDINKDLVPAGKTSKGDTVYELKDKNSKILKDQYDSVYFPEGKKMTFAQFVAKHPQFYWIDPFGRLLKFTDSDFGPLAECGKPVIYLYPTKTTSVSVKLYPQGGFSYTEPAYNSGWNVIATPSGIITNKADNKTYPYLFWEGRGGYYQMPDKGFVVSQAGLHGFLIEKLAKLGLNQQETADFIEFWEPKMQGRPYYFVTFMGNQVMDKIAPLEISPSPDTVIRVLMDYKGLDKPIAVQDYNIQTPERKGFTVVEWGGVLK